MKLNSKDLRHNILKNKIENIYLFSGPEIGEKKEIIGLIEKKLFNEMDPVRYTFYIDKDFDITDFFNTLKSGLLFSEKKIVLLRNIEDINSEIIRGLTNYLIPKIIEERIFNDEILNKIKESEDEKFIKKIYKKIENFYKVEKELTIKEKKEIINIFSRIGFKNYDQGTFLIMLNETNEKIPSGLPELLTEEQQIIFWEMFESQKKEWIKQEFKNKNYYIEDEAIFFILDMVENNKQQLTDEINKIIFFIEELKPADKVVKKILIEDFLYHSKEETPFSLYSSMLECNLTKSLDILKTLFLTNEDNLLNGLVWCHRRFLNAIDLYENQKMTSYEIFSTLKITNKKNKEEFEQGFSAYNFFHASKMFFYLSELDYYLKILPGNLKLIKLQEFVINFIKGDSKKIFLQGDIELVNI